MRPHSILLKGSLCLFTALLLQVSAQADVLLYGFDGTYDGWTNFSTSYNTSSSPGGQSVTQGTNSAGWGGGDWWATPAGVIPNSATITSFTGAFASLVGNTQIAIDLTQIYMTSPTYASWENWGFNLKITGHDSDGNFFDTATVFVPNIYGNESRVYTNTTPSTLAFDYSAIAGGDIANGTAQDFYFSLSSFSAGGWSVTGNTNQLAMDNFRVVTAVPEPATVGLALAGIAGLTLSRRRRK